MGHIHKKVHIPKKRFKKKKIIFVYKPNKVVLLISSKLNLFLQNQIESARVVISKKTKRSSKLYNQLSSKIPTTKKSRGSRMGKGQGKFNNFVYIMRPGQIIFKLYGISTKLCLNAI